MVFGGLPRSTGWMVTAVAIHSGLGGRIMKVYFGSYDFTRREQGNLLVGLGIVVIMFGVGILIGGKL